MQMEYIDLARNSDTIYIRDARNRIHSGLLVLPDGTMVEQSRSHREIVQRCSCPDGRLILSYFSEIKAGKTEIRRAKPDVVILQRSSPSDLHS